MVEVHQRAFSKPHGEHLPVAQSKSATAHRHLLNSVTDRFRNTNSLRLGPIRFPATVRGARVQDQSVWGLPASTRFRLAPRTRPQILGGMVSWKSRLARF